jgi:hypothetical protein
MAETIRETRKIRRMAVIGKKDLIGGSVYWKQAGSSYCAVVGRPDASRTNPMRFLLANSKR